MVHDDSTWLGRICARHGTRTVAPLGLLLACVLLACFASTASASNYDIRGEWSVEFTSAHQPTLLGMAVLNKQEPNGEFSGSGLLGGFIQAPFSGTVSGDETSLTIVAEAPGENVTFMSTSLSIDTVHNTIEGTGAYYIEGKLLEPGEVKAVRLKTYKQIEEQQEQEEKEREEREARAGVRGEWALTIELGPQSVKGTALVSDEASAKNEFASASALFESVVPGAFSGTLESSEASVTVITQAAGPYPEGKFTGTKLALTSTAGSMSITGLGTLTLGGISAPATLTATRTKTYQELVNREKQEREAKEAQEKAEKEALEAKEKSERELAEKVAREVKEKQEREKREVAEKAVLPKTLSLPLPAPAALVSVELAGKSVTASVSGQVSLQIDNPNSYTVSGRVALLLAQSHGAGKSSSKKAASLGTASFGLSPNGKQLVKLKLSRRGRSELAHHKTLHALATITTDASGQVTTTKTFSLTLHVGSRAHH